MRYAVTAYLHARALEGGAPLTLASHRYILSMFASSIGWLSIRNVTTAHVREWLGGSPIAASTARTRLATLRVFFHWCIREGLSDTDPTAPIRSPRMPRRLPRALSHDSVRALLQVAPDVRARLVVMLMVQLGLRRGEVARLQIGDIDFRARTVHVVGKGGHERLLPIVGSAWDALDAYLLEHPATSGPLVRAYRRPTGLQPEWFSREMTRWMRTAGIKRTAYDGVSSHALRHTAATDVLARVKDPRIVQTMLGHASLAATHLYTQLALDVEMLRTAMDDRHYG